MSKLPPPSATPKMQDHIFISYSSKDRAFVDQLADKLRGLGHTVWIDFEGIRGGERWKQSIADGLHPSRVVLLVLSPDSIESEWVEEEVRLAQELDKLIIPLLLRPLPDAIPSDVLREVLREIQYRDFTKGFQHPFEQLLGDLPRPESGIMGYCAKLVARLAALPWGLDHYIQEQAKILPIHASPYDEGLGRQPSENLLERLKVSKRTIVLGEPGMGKSVALERLAWELANAEPPVVPVIINLREYDGQPLLAWIRLMLIASDEPAIHDALRQPDDIDRYLRDTPFTFYFLLDGLNEVRPAYREGVLHETRRLALEFPQYPMVVTSRIQDESWRELCGGSFDAETVVVQSITEQQALAYLVAHLTEGDANNLWRRLDDRMRGLTTTPLLLWLIKEAWQETKGRIPGNRGELYASFIERMLRRDHPKISASVAEEERLSALRTLALAMHNERAISFTREQVLGIISDKRVLDALLVNGLLQGDSILRFAPHQTIQEHFAARGIQAEVEATLNARPRSWLRSLFTQPEANVLDLTKDVWWAETFIQLAGITTDPNRLAQRIAEHNPWLAWWCVQEGRAVDPETERVIQAQSARLVDSDNVADRRNAVQALLRLPRARVIPELTRLACDINSSVGEPAQQALQDLGESGKQAIGRAFDTRLRQLSTPGERAEYGRQIAGHDPRFGVDVIVREDGLKLPDIDWVEIPNDGEWTYQYDKHPGLPAFQIARYPVTYAQFQCFADAPDYDDDRWWKGMPEKSEIWSGATYRTRELEEQRFKYANHPRENVAWYQAVAFCRWLSDKLGYEVTLPTEEQWEKAARGTDGREYPYEGAFDAGKGNTEETGIGQTSAVGIFPSGASPYGVLDMSGNVLEWCLNKYKTPDDVAVDASGAYRVLRGGSWSNNPDRARAVYRNPNVPLNRNLNRGFRLLCLPHFLNR